MTFVDLGPATPTQPILALVHDDALEPLLELVVITETEPAPPGCDESVVRRIAGVGRVAQDRAGQPIGIDDLAIGQPAEAAARSSSRPSVTGRNSPRTRLSRSSTRVAPIPMRRPMTNFCLLDDPSGTNVRSIIEVTRARAGAGIRLPIG